MMDSPRRDDRVSGGEATRSPDEAVSGQSATYASYARARAQHQQVHHGVASPARSTAQMNAQGGNGEQRPQQRVRKSRFWRRWHEQQQQQQQRGQRSELPLLQQQYQSQQNAEARADASTQSNRSRVDRSASQDGNANEGVFRKASGGKADVHSQSQHSGSRSRSQAPSQTEGGRIPRKRRAAESAGSRSRDGSGGIEQSKSWAHSESDSIPKKRDRAMASFDDGAASRGGSTDAFDRLRRSRSMPQAAEAESIPRRGDRAKSVDHNSYANNQPRRYHSRDGYTRKRDRASTAAYNNDESRKSDGRSHEGLGRSLSWDFSPSRTQRKGDQATNAKDERGSCNSSAKDQLGRSQSYDANEQQGRSQSRDGGTPSQIGPIPDMIFLTPNNADEDNDPSEKNGGKPKNFQSQDEALKALKQRKRAKAAAAWKQRKFGQGCGGGGDGSSRREVEDSNERHTGKSKERRDRGDVISLLNERDIEDGHVGGKSSKRGQRKGMQNSRGRGTKYTRNVEGRIPKKPMSSGKVWGDKANKDDGSGTDVDGWDIIDSDNESTADAASRGKEMPSARNDAKDDEVDPEGKTGNTGQNMKILPSMKADANPTMDDKGRKLSRKDGKAKADDALKNENEARADTVDERGDESREKSKPSSKQPSNMEPRAMRLRLKTVEGSGAGSSSDSSSSSTEPWVRDKRRAKESPASDRARGGDESTAGSSSTDPWDRDRKAYGAKETLAFDEAESDESIGGLSSKSPCVESQQDKDDGEREKNGIEASDGVAEPLASRRRTRSMRNAETLPKSKLQNGCSERAMGQKKESNNSAEATQSRQTRSSSILKSEPPQGDSRQRRYRQARRQSSNVYFSVDNDDESYIQSSNAGRKRGATTSATQSVTTTSGISNKQYRPSYQDGSYVNSVVHGGPPRSIKGEESLSLMQLWRRERKKKKKRRLRTTRLFLSDGNRKDEDEHERRRVRKRNQLFRHVLLLPGESLPRDSDASDVDSDVQQRRGRKRGRAKTTSSTHSVAVDNQHVNLWDYDWDDDSSDDNETKVEVDIIGEALFEIQGKRLPCSHTLSLSEPTDDHRGGASKMCDQQSNGNDAALARITSLRERIQRADDLIQRKAPACIEFGAQRWVAGGAAASLRMPGKGSNGMGPGLSVAAQSNEGNDTRKAIHPGEQRTVLTLPPRHKSHAGPGPAREFLAALHAAAAGAGGDGHPSATSVVTNFLSIIRESRDSSSQSPFQLMKRVWELILTVVSRHDNDTSAELDNEMVRKFELGKDLARRFDAFLPEGYSMLSGNLLFLESFAAASSSTTNGFEEGCARTNAKEG